uniref:Uncharacterized protein n=1 Tax=Anguilla anguilla TaxID=7936 RepID=A0A0E9R1E3_ANGAN
MSSPGLKFWGKCITTSGLDQHSSNCLSLCFEYSSTIANRVGTLGLLLTVVDTEVIFARTHTHTANALLLYNLFFPSLFLFHTYILNPKKRSF